jgi:hypothetical protein
LLLTDPRIRLIGFGSRRHIKLPAPTHSDNVARYGTFAY